MIRKMAVVLDEAQKSGVGEDELDPARARLIQSIDDCDQSRYDEVYKATIQTRADIAEILRKKREVRWRFQIALYGLRPIAYGMFWLILSGWLLVSWPASDLQALLHPSTVFGIPYWPMLVASLGASIQILVSVAGDVQGEGYVQDNRQDWYLILPFVSFVFGFLAYILYQTGLISLGVTSTAPAAEAQALLPVIVCFLSGYATNWFIKQLDKLASSK